MPEITTARVALLISILVALWNLLKHLLEGGRVRVKLRPGLHYDYGLTQSDTWASVAENSTKRGGWSVEVAVIEVENIGRTAVTISGASLVFRSKPWWRHKRYSIVPFAREAPGALTASSHRLEPFDSATFVYDAWIGLEVRRSHFDTPVRPLTMRASVKVAGKRRPRWSPWRSRWRVTEGQLAFIPELARIEMLTYRRMLRHTYDDKHAKTACIPTAIDVGRQFPVDGPAPTREQLTQIIERHYFGKTKEMVPLIAYDLAEDLGPLYESGSDAGDLTQ